jgi:hypothetical protein
MATKNPKHYNFGYLLLTKHSREINPKKIQELTGASKVTPVYVRKKAQANRSLLKEVCGTAISMLNIYFDPRTYLIQGQVTSDFLWLKYQEEILATPNFNSATFIKFHNDTLALHDFIVAKYAVEDLARMHQDVIALKQLFPAFGNQTEADASIAYLENHYFTNIQATLTQRVRDHLKNAW